MKTLNRLLSGYDRMLFSLALLCGINNLEASSIPKSNNCFEAHLTGSVKNECQTNVFNCSLKGNGKEKEKEKSKENNPSNGCKKSDPNPNSSSATPTNECKPRELYSIHLTGSIRAQYETNVFRSGLTQNTEESDPSLRDHKYDFIWVFTPGVDVLIGDDTSYIKGRITFYEDFYFYSKYTVLNRELANLHINFDIKGDCWTISPYGSFEQIHYPYNSIFSAEKRIMQDTAIGGVLWTYNLNCKNTLISGFEYKDVKLQKEVYLQGYSTVRIPLVLYYKVTPRFEIGPSAQFEYFNVQGGNDGYVFFAGLAARGQICAKANYEIHLGGMYTHMSLQHYRATLGGHAQLNLHINDKTNIFMYLKRYVTPHFYGDMVIASVAGAVMNYQIRKKWNLELSANVVELDFINPTHAAPYYFISNNPQREDEFITGGAKLTYAPCETIALSAGYIYNATTSNTSALYMNTYWHQVYLMASIRY